MRVSSCFRWRERGSLRYSTMNQKCEFSRSTDSLLRLTFRKLVVFFFVSIKLERHKTFSPGALTLAYSLHHLGKSSRLFDFDPALGSLARQNTSTGS